MAVHSTSIFQVNSMQTNMKKILLVAFLIISSFRFGVAQNTIAILKYEEAEEAYAANNFELAISKLNEAETLLKATNPKILYLKILSESKIIENSPLNYCPLIEDLNPLVGKYLKEYDNLPDNQEKFRDVYRIGEKFKNYPTSAEAFEDKKNEAKENEKKKYDAVFMGYLLDDKRLKLGLTLEEAKRIFPENFKSAPGKDLNKGEFYYHSLGTLNLWVKKGMVYGYSVEISRFSDDPAFTKGAMKASGIVKKLTDHFNFEPRIETPTDHSVKGIKVLATSYVWEKYNKKVTVIFSQMSQSRPYPVDKISVVYFEQFDNYLVE